MLSRTTTAVVYILKGMGHVIHCYLDYLAGMAAAQDEANKVCTYLVDTVEKLGLTLSSGKCVAPIQTVGWPGSHPRIETLGST